MFEDRLFEIVYSKLGWESKTCLYYRAWRGELDSDKIISINKKALKGYVRSYNVKIVNSKDPKMQFIGVEGLLTDLLKETIGHKYMQTLVVTFKKNEIHKMVYFNSKQKTIINTNEITSGLLESNAEITNKIDVWISEGSGWTIERIEKHYINFAKYKPLKGSSYVELLKELKHHRKSLINVQNKDNECFTWCHIRHLNPQKKEPQRVK